MLSTGRSKSERRYLSVDGGSGARILARLPHPEEGRRLIPVSSPRHAHLLLVFEPLSRKLAHSVIELYRAMPRPRRALVIGAPGTDHFAEAGLVRLEDLMPDVERIPPKQSSPEAIQQQMLTVPLSADEAPSQPLPEPITVQLPGKHEREIATEPVVLSLGPVQPFTAGPLRLLLTCDGEQIVSAQVEAGYGRRDVAGAMTRAPWEEIPGLAGSLDPLAPFACRLAYVTALEQLQQREPDPMEQQQRQVALAIERAQNHLAWVVRFTRVLADGGHTAAARQLNESLAEVSPASGEPFSSGGNITRGSISPFWHDEGSASLEHLAAAIGALRGRVERDRTLAHRTAGIGPLPEERLRVVGASGPALRASERGEDDVRARLLTRLDEAAETLREASGAASLPRGSGSISADLGRSAAAERELGRWSAPEGCAEASVEGPRGVIGLSLVSDGERLLRVTWRRPSSVLLGLVPELLAGQKLADAEVIAASLDLSMAEADG